MNDVLVCVCERIRTCGPSAVSVVSVLLCSHRLQDQRVPAGTSLHPFLKHTGKQLSFSTIKRHIYDPQNLFFENTFNRAFMLVIISILQSCPSSLRCTRPRYLFSPSCLRLNRLFVLRVRKLRRRNALVRLFQ